ncbi:hypothetical protein RCL1_000707 [Eukaryota sp. TZLM3-RCL]
MDPVSEYVGQFKRIVRLDPSVRNIQKWYRSVLKRRYLNHFSDISRKIDLDKKRRHLESLILHSKATRFARNSLLTKYCTGWHLFAQRQNVVQIMQKRLTLLAAKTALRGWRWICQESYAARRKANWAQQRLVKRRATIIFHFWARWATYECSLRRNEIPRPFQKPLPAWNRYLETVRSKRLLEAKLEEILYVRLTLRIAFQGWAFVLFTEKQHRDRIAQADKFRKFHLKFNGFSTLYIHFFYRLRFLSRIGPLILDEWRYIAKRDKLLRERFPSGVSLREKSLKIRLFRGWLKYHSIRDQLALMSALTLTSNPNLRSRACLFLSIVINPANSPETLMWTFLLHWKYYSARKSLAISLMFSWGMRLMKRVFYGWKQKNPEIIPDPDDDNSTPDHLFPPPHVFLVPMDEAKVLSIGLLNSSKHKTPFSLDLVSSPQLLSSKPLPLDLIVLPTDAPLNVKVFITFKRIIAEKFLQLCGLNCLNLDNDEEQESSIKNDCLSTMDFISIIIQTRLLITQSNIRSKQIRVATFTPINFDRRVKEASLLTKAILVKVAGTGVKAYVMGLSNPIKDLLSSTFDRMSKSKSRLRLLQKAADFEVEYQAKLLSKFNSKFKLKFGNDELIPLNYFSKLGHFSSSTPLLSSETTASTDNLHEALDPEVLQLFGFNPNPNPTTIDTSEPVEKWFLKQSREIVGDEPDDSVLVRLPRVIQPLALSSSFTSTLPTPNSRAAAYNKLIKPITPTTPKTIELKSLYSKKKNNNLINLKFFIDEDDVSSASPTFSPVIEAVKPNNFEAISIPKRIKSPPPPVREFSDDESDGESGQNYVERGNRDSDESQECVDDFCEFDQNVAVSPSNQSIISDDLFSSPHVLSIPSKDRRASDTTLLSTNQSKLIQSHRRSSDTLLELPKNPQLFPTSSQIFKPNFQQQAHSRKISNGSIKSDSSRSVSGHSSRRSSISTEMFLQIPSSKTIVKKVKKKVRFADENGVKEEELLQVPGNFSSPLSINSEEANILTENFEYSDRDMSTVTRNFDQLAEKIPQSPKKLHKNSKKIGKNSVVIQSILAFNELSFTDELPLTEQLASVVQEVVSGKKEMMERKDSEMVGGGEKDEVKIVNQNDRKGKTNQLQGQKSEEMIAVSKQEKRIRERENRRKVEKQSKIELNSPERINHFPNQKSNVPLIEPLEYDPSSPPQPPNAPRVSSFKDSQISRNFMQNRKPNLSIITDFTEEFERKSRHQSKMIKRLPLKDLYETRIDEARQTMEKISPLPSPRQSKSGKFLVGAELAPIFSHEIPEKSFNFLVEGSPATPTISTFSLPKLQINENNLTNSEIFDEKFVEKSVPSLSQNQVSKAKISRKISKLIIPSTSQSRLPCVGENDLFSSSPNSPFNHPSSCSSPHSSHYKSSPNFSDNNSEFAHSFQGSFVDMSDFDFTSRESFNFSKNSSENLGSDMDSNSVNFDGNFDGPDTWRTVDRGDPFERLYKTNLLSKTSNFQNSVELDKKEALLRAKNQIFKETKHSEFYSRQSNFEKNSLKIPNLDLNFPPELSNKAKNFKNEMENFGFSDIPVENILPTSLALNSPSLGDTSSRVGPLISQADVLNYLPSAVVHDIEKLKQNLIETSPPPLSPENFAQKFGSKYSFSDQIPESRATSSLSIRSFATIPPQPPTRPTSTPHPSPFVLNNFTPSAQNLPRNIPTPGSVLRPKSQKTYKNTNIFNNSTHSKSFSSLALDGRSASPGLVRPCTVAVGGSDPPKPPRSSVANYSRKIFDDFIESKPFLTGSKPPTRSKQSRQSIKSTPTSAIPIKEEIKQSKPQSLLIDLNFNLSLDDLPSEIDIPLLSDRSVGTPPGRPVSRAHSARRSFYLESGPQKSHQRLVVSKKLGSNFVLGRHFG